MTNLPINMELINEQNQLTLSSGSTEIDYFFSTNTIVNPIENTQNEKDYSLYVIIGGIIIFVSLILLAKSNQDPFLEKK